MIKGTKAQCYNIECKIVPSKPVALVNLTLVKQTRSIGDFYLCKHCLDWCHERYTVIYKWKCTPPTYSRDDNMKENLKHPRKAISF